MKRVIVVPDLYSAAPYAHAVRVDEILYTSAIAPVDRNGSVVSPGRLLPQVQKIYDNISQILDVAGVTWAEVVKINHFFEPPGPSVDELDAMRTSLANYLRPNEQAGTDICLAPSFSGSRMQVEVIAHVGVEKRVLTADTAGLHGRCWAPGIRVGRHVYLSAHRAYQTAQLASTKTSTLTSETNNIYTNFDTLLRQANVAWRDLVRVRQFVSDPLADFNQVREGRRDYVPFGAFTSTSICCLEGDPSGNPSSPWTIATDLEATTGTKIAVNSNALAHTPGTAHALKVGNLVHLQAEISTNEQNEIVFQDDIEAQARHVLQKMDLLLATAGCEWGDVVTSRIFCKMREHLQTVRRIEREWAGGAIFAKSDAISRFFDPNVLVEIELTAARTL